jgi:hypothetical protein
MGAETPVFSYEVTTRDLAGLPDARGDSVKGMLASNYGVEVGSVRVILEHVSSRTAHRHPSRIQARRH